MPGFDTARDIPDLSGKVIFITGGTAGLGTQTIRALAAHSPSQIFFTGRSTARAEAIIAELQQAHPSVKVTFLKTDLESLASVTETAKNFISSFSNTPRLDILICNAGILAASPGLTSDGYELQFGTNHVSHALLIKLLLPTLLETTKQPDSDVRVVSLASLGFSGHPRGGILFSSLKTPQPFFFAGPWQRYGQSKLANILYAAELSCRYNDSGILFLSIHPGTFNTGLVKNLDVVNRSIIWIVNAGNVKDEAKEGEGAWNACWAATGSRDSMENGGFYLPVGVRASKVRENRNEKLAKELWEWTEKELEEWNL